MTAPQLSAPGGNVGVVGVGTMGLPVAANLLAAGYGVVGYRRSPVPAQFLALGGTVASSPAELASRCDAVLVILPGPDALLQVVLGDTGLAAGARQGSVIVEMSTMPIAVKERCREALAQRGAAMLDAPISGMPAMVTNRTASIFGSGDEQDFATVRAVLEAVTGRVEHLGPFGAGSVTKYVAHLLLAVNTLATAEALGLARRAGVDLDRLLQVLSGTVASSAAMTARGPLMARGQYRPAPGSVATLHEGLEQVDDFARQLGALPPLLELALGLYGKARVDGHADDDIAVMIDVLASGYPPGDSSGSLPPAKPGPALPPAPAA